MRSLLRQPNDYKKMFYFFSSPRLKMSEKNIIFNDEKIIKSKFYKNKKLSKIDEINVNF